MSEGYWVADLPIVEHCLTVVLREMVDATVSGRLTEVEGEQVQHTMRRIGVELETIESFKNRATKTALPEIEGQTNIYEHLDKEVASEGDQADR